MTDVADVLADLSRELNDFGRELDRRAPSPATFQRMRQLVDRALDAVAEEERMAALRAAADEETEGGTRHGEPRESLPRRVGYGSR